MNTSKQIVTPKEFLFAVEEDDKLPLDCGRTLRNVTLKYETYGQLDKDKRNAILILHALSGDAHVCGYHSPSDDKPGWWNEMVGPGKPIDTNKYFVICSNVIGGCSGSTGPRSINPETGKPYNLDFPVRTIADMVRAQQRLIEYLEIPELLAVVGGSMGGMQALQWSISYPEMVHSVAAIATTAQLSPQSIAFDWIGRSAIQYDHEFVNGNYDDEFPPEHGLSIARMLAHVTYLSDESMAKKFGRGLQNSNSYTYKFDRDFAVESYLRYQGQRFVERFDANSYLYITKAMDYFDLSALGNGSLTQAFAGARANYLVVSFTSDWLFTTKQSEEIVRALLNNSLEVSFCEIESSYGHDAFLLEIETLGRIVSDFLRNQLMEWRKDECK